MIYRLLILIGAAIILVGEPALADFVLRIDARGHAPATVQANDDEGYGGYDGYGNYDPGWDDSYYGSDGYPLYLTPGRVPAPVALPPIIARPIPPQPMIRIRLRNGERILVPYTRIQRLDIPSYPDYATSGLAYIPTPTYPFVPVRRFHHHGQRQRER